MFLISKMFLLFSSSGFWLLALLCCGIVLVWTNRLKIGRWVLTITICFLLIISVMPVGQLMVSTLEDIFPRNVHLQPPVSGIIVLGGFIDPIISETRGQPTLNNAAERVTAFLSLAKNFSKAKLVFTGGSGNLTRNWIKEADKVKELLRNIGFDTNRVIFERNARNTYENGVNLYRLLHPKPHERWVLITSAVHMPRAIGVFHKLNWHPIPYPVDFRTRGKGDWHWTFNMKNGLQSFDLGLREWLGLVFYRILGRTNSYLPNQRP